MTLTGDFTEKIWVPDTFFANDKLSYLHTVTEKNHMIRVYGDGSVVYGMRSQRRVMAPAQSKWNWNKTVKQIPFRVNEITAFYFSRRTMREIKHGNVSAAGEGHMQICKSKLSAQWNWNKTVSK